MQYSNLTLLIRVTADDLRLISEIRSFKRHRSCRTQVMFKSRCLSSGDNSCISFARDRMHTTALGSGLDLFDLVSNPKAAA